MVKSWNTFFQICRACFEKLLWLGSYPVGASIWLTIPAEVRSGGDGQTAPQARVKVGAIGGPRSTSPDAAIALIGEVQN
jgi:hypothetical protein